MSTDRRTDEEDTGHTYDGNHSATRQKEILLFVATWTDLEGVMRSGISPAETHTARSHFRVASEQRAGGNQQLSGVRQGWAGSRGRWSGAHTSAEMGASRGVPRHAADRQHCDLCFKQRESTSRKFSPTYGKGLGEAADSQLQSPQAVRAVSHHTAHAQRAQGEMHHISTALETPTERYMKF